MTNVIDDRETSETVSTATTTIEDNVCIYILYNIIISLFHIDIFEYELLA